MSLLAWEYAEEKEVWNFHSQPDKDILIARYQGLSFLVGLKSSSWWHLYLRVEASSNFQTKLGEFKNLQCAKKHAEAFCHSFMPEEKPSEDPKMTEQEKLYLMFVLGKFSKWFYAAHKNLGIEKTMDWLLRDDHIWIGIRGKSYKKEFMVSGDLFTGIADFVGDMMLKTMAELDEIEKQKIEDANA